jgi:hypothetical protein
VVGDGISVVTRYMRSDCVEWYKVTEVNSTSKAAIAVKTGGRECPALWNKTPASLVLTWRAKTGVWLPKGVTKASMRGAPVYVCRGHVIGHQNNDPW